MILSPNSNQYLSLISKDLSSKYDFSNNSSYLTTAVRSKLISNQINSFLGLFGYLLKIMDLGLFIKIK
jgi:hypothetical protein